MQVFPRQFATTAKLAQELDIGEPTLKDIVAELEKPARDPRDEMPKPILRSDVLENEGPERRNDFEGYREKRHRLRGVCGHWRTPGRLVHISHFPPKSCQTSVGSRKSWRRCGRESACVDLQKKRISLTMII